MKEVFVYVEGPSDQLGMRLLLADLFSAAGVKYKDTADAPWVLERSDYLYLMNKGLGNK